MDEEDNYLTFVQIYAELMGGPIFQVESEAEAHVATAAFIPTWEAERVWLRVVKRRNRYVFSISLDGETFLTATKAFDDPIGLHQRGVTWGKGSVKYVGLFANNGGAVGAPEVDASFDFFEVRSLSGETGHQRNSVSAQ